MSARVPWFERRWNFQFPVGCFPDILERLRGTPARAEDAVQGLDVHLLTRREREGTWSIQENVGHLLDLDGLWSGRLDDFLSGAATLRAADLSNRTTHEADHNGKEIGDLLAALRASRTRLMSRFDSLGDSDFARTARHPRLETPMRLVDMCLFTADHDDYHLARIRDLIGRFA